MDTPRAQLEALRAEAAVRAEHAASALAELIRDRRESNDDDEHDPEGVPLSSEWSRLSALSDAAAEALQEVDDALARLDAGTYGICSSCGKPIPAARLEIRPFAELCVPCAEQNH